MPKIKKKSFTTCYGCQTHHCCYENKPLITLHIKAFPPIQKKPHNQKGSPPPSFLLFWFAPLFGGCQGQTSVCVAARTHSASASASAVSPERERDPVWRTSENGQKKGQRERERERERERDPVHVQRDDAGTPPSLSRRPPSASVLRRQSLRGRRREKQAEGKHRVQPPSCTCWCLRRKKRNDASSRVYCMGRKRRSRTLCPTIFLGHLLYDSTGLAWKHDLTRYALGVQYIAPALLNHRVDRELKKHIEKLVSLKCT